MARGFENVKTIKAHEPMTELYTDEEIEEVPAHPLDSPENQATLSRLKDWWYQAQAAQRDNRAEMVKDQEFYDGEQWTEEDKRVLENRGQAPLVFNKIKPTVDWVLGSERQARVEAKVLPRKKIEGDVAQVKTDLLKYISDVNKLPYHQSRAFTDTVIVGVGWLEHGVRSDATEEPLFDRYESWRNIWYDHLAVEMDLSDSRFLFRARWVDLDIAQAMFPDRAAELKNEAINANSLFPFYHDDFGAWHVPTDGTVDMIEGDVFANTGNSRLRVRLVECWYRKTEMAKVVSAKGRPEHGAIFKDWDPVLGYLVSQGIASTFDAVKQVVYCGIFCGATFLQNQISPYRHNRIPFNPIWCYRRGRDNAPYGMIRNLRDPQEDLNKRASKSLYILSTNRIIADSDATENWKEMRAEADRPDGVIRKKKGSDVKLETDRGVANDHLVMMDRDARFIQDVAGVTDENMGRDTSATSGKAIMARQNQGLTSTAVVFDNLYYAIQNSGEIRLSLVEQFYDEEKTIRIAGDNGRLEFVDINKADGDGLLNDITSTQADYVVSQQDYRATMRQAMFDSMLELIEKLDPQVSLALLDLVVEMSDMPGRDELVARIRQINGQKDPNADADDPEQLAIDKAKAEEENQQKKMAADEKRAQIKLLLAQAKKADADGTAKLVESLYSAIQTGQVIIANPGVAPLADEVALSAGFSDHNAAPVFPVPQTGSSKVPGSIIPENTHPMFPANPAGPSVGIAEGIETQRLDGIGE